MKSRPKIAEFNDLFYNLDDVINLFKSFTQERFYRNYKITNTIGLFTGEYAKKLTYYKKWH